MQYILLVSIFNNYINKIYFKLLQKIFINKVLNFLKEKLIQIIKIYKFFNFIIYIKN